MPLTVCRAAARVMLKELGFETVANWPDARLSSKLATLGDIVDDETEWATPAARELAANVIAADAIVFADETAEAAPAPKAEKPAKPAKAEKPAKVAEPDAEAEDDGELPDTMKPAKPAKAEKAEKPAKPPKAEKPAKAEKVAKPEAEAPAEAAGEPEAPPAEKPPRKQAYARPTVRGPEGVRPDTSNIMYIVGATLKKFGLESGVTTEMIAHADKLARRSNPAQTQFNLRQAFHAIRGYVGAE